MNSHDAASTIRWRSPIFFSGYGLRSGWRSLIFVAVFIVISMLLTRPLRHLSHGSGTDVRSLLFMEMASAASALLATWICVRFVERKPLSAFGFAKPRAGRRFAAGLTVGFLSLTLLFFLLELAGVERLLGFALHDGEILRYGALWGLTFLIVAINEEVIARGYLLFTLTQGIGFWPAVGVLSLVFAGGHLRNPGEQLIGIAAAGIVGAVLAWSVQRTGSLWWAIGFHAAWDWAESYFYGVPDSGNVSEGHLLNSAASGAHWLSGGTTGPEGSVLVFPVIFVIALLVWRSLPKTPPPELQRLR